jgi:hypothetical protein
MKSFPFDSQLTYDSAGVPSYDRACDSKTLRSYTSLFFSDGVFPNPSTGLQVTTSEQEMSVTVMPGSINIQGALAIEEVERTLVFQASNATYDRIDSVVARFNSNYEYRDIDLYVVEGTPAATPAAPELTRTGGIYELRLANVFIAKGTTSISGARITDTRLDTDDCGIVTGVLKQVDTATIFNQYEAWFKEISTNGENEINEITSDYMSQCETLVTQMKDLLSEDAAAKLQIEIGVPEQIEIGDGSLTSAILEILTRLGIGILTTEEGDYLATEDNINFIV